MADKKKVDAVTGAARSAKRIKEDEARKVLLQGAKEINAARRNAGKDTLSTVEAAKLWVGITAGRRR